MQEEPEWQHGKGQNVHNSESVVCNTMFFHFFSQEHCTLNSERQLICKEKVMASDLSPNV